MVFIIVLDLVEVWIKNGSECWPYHIGGHAFSQRKGSDIYKKEVSLTAYSSHLSHLYMVHTVDCM
jgi:hypothetical protein